MLQGVSENLGVFSADLNYNEEIGCRRSAGKDALVTTVTEKIMPLTEPVASASTLE